MNHRLKLKDIADVTSGSNAPKEKDFSESGLPFIRAGHLESLIDGLSINCLPKINEITSEKLKLKKAPKNSILFAKSGMSCKKNRVYKTNAESFIVNHLACITLKSDNVNIDYLKYFFEWFKPSTLIRDESYPSIRLTDISNIELALPNLSTQNKIAEALNLVVKIIKIRKQQIEALSDLKQSIFLDMFGDPHMNTKKWANGKIADITRKTQYGTSKKASETDGAYPVLRMNNITYEGEMDFSDLKYVDLAEEEKEKYLVYPGELLFNRTNSRELVGKTAVYNDSEPVTFAGYLVKLIPNEKANSFFISGYLNSHYGKRYLFNLAKNSIGMSNINATELRNIPIYIPPIDLQNDYKNKICFINEKVKLLKKGLKGIEVLYQSLLHKAFNGELFMKENVKV